MNQLSVKEKRIAKKINVLTKVDIFQRTRRREVIEARALFIHILNKYEKVRPTDISRKIILGNIKINHATVLHSLNMFSVYRKFNKNMTIWLDNILTSEKNEDIEIKKQYIKDMVDVIEDKYILELNNKARDLFEENIIDMTKEE